MKDDKRQETGGNMLGFLCPDICRTQFRYSSMHCRQPSRVFVFLYLHVPGCACVGEFMILGGVCDLGCKSMCVCVCFECSVHLGSVSTCLFFPLSVTVVTRTFNITLFTKTALFQSSQWFFDCPVLQMYVQYLYVNILYPSRLFISKLCIAWMSFLTLSKIVFFFFFYLVCLRCICGDNWTVNRWRHVCKCQTNHGSLLDIMPTRGQLNINVQAKRLWTNTCDCSLCLRLYS